MTGDQPDAGTVAPRHDAEAVGVDLVNPVGAGRRSKREIRTQGIDWDRDDFIMRDVTPGRIAVYENVDGQVTIKQGEYSVFVGRRDFKEFMYQLRRFAYEMGYEDLSAQLSVTQ
jgi:hypothetical protein